MGTLFACILVEVTAQVVLQPGTHIETFDNLSSGLSPGWSVRTGASATALGTESDTINFAATSWGSVTGNFRNVASLENPGVASGDSVATQSGYADRALGIRQTGTFGDPGAAFTFHLSSVGLSLTDIRFSAQIAPPSTSASTTWSLQYGLGSNPGSFTTLASFADPGAFGFTTVVGSNLGGALDNQSDIWLRVVALDASVGGGSRDTFAIDNFSITAVSAVPEPSTYAALFGAAALTAAYWRRRKAASSATNL